MRRNRQFHITFSVAKNYINEILLCRGRKQSYLCLTKRVTETKIGSCNSFYFVSVFFGTLSNSVDGPWNSILKVEFFFIL